MPVKPKDPLDYKPVKGHFHTGLPGQAPDVMAWTPKEVTAKNWIKRFKFFKSPTGSIDQAFVYSEYTSAINEFLQKNPGSSLTDIRRKLGVIVSVDGKEALTEIGDFLRRSRENQQRPVITEQGKVIEKKKDLPPKYIRTGSSKNYKGQYLDSLREVLEENNVKLDARLEDLKWEGHHIKGLGNLDPFYTGATDAEKFSLNQTLINNGYTAGETRGNFAWLSKEQHQAAHRKLGWGADEAMTDFDRSSTIPEYDPKAITSKQKGVSNLSPKTQAKIKAAPFNRPKWQQELLEKGVLPKNIDNFKISRADYLKEWLDLTDDAYVDVVNQAIRDNPIQGIDPELQIQANIRHSNPQLFEDYRAISKRGTKGWTMDGLMKSTTGLSRAESMVRIMGGDYVGGALGLAMTTPTAQKQFANLAKALKTGAKTTGTFGTLASKGVMKQAFKWLPGVSLGSGALQAWGYAAGGQWTKAGLSMMGGFIGEMGPAGDVAQAAIDLGLTTHDMTSVKGRKPKKPKKPEVKLNSDDDVIRMLGRIGRRVELNPRAWL